MDPLRRTLTDSKAERILLMVEKLRELDDEFPAQLLSTLLYVASHKDCHKQALEEDLSFTTASSSRNTDRLSAQHRLNKPGLDLIIKEKDPGNGRRLQLKLTEQGQFLIDQLKGILYD
jgi:DNA-binding MarR family transcriptional regulator